MAPKYPKLLWHRYIDDVLLIWDGPLALLKQFLSALNTNEYNLTFTHSYSDTEILFLDVLIRLDPQGGVSTTLFCKSTAGNSLLRADSAHPSALKKFISYAQYMRPRRICSTVEEFDTQAGKLQVRFLR